MDSGYEANARSIWPSIYPALLELVRAHRSTIVFVNNRRLAERLALRINELAEENVARAHHGSLAREQRVLIEEDLKAGRIPCLVATSSLELGIDMGAVDLVVQVESPKSVARGLQRVGRAGHELGAVSKGRIFPKFRADLLECAVVAKAMREGAIEETAIPRNPLDVLAQQIVAICADDEIAVDELHALVRGAYPFAELPRAAARQRARHARRPLSVRRVRRAPAAHRVGSHRRGDPRADGRPAARGHERRHDPRPRDVRRLPGRTAAAGSASSTRRWSTRRARARRSCSAPRPGGSRRSPATACSCRPRPASRVRCRSGRAREWGGHTSSGRGSARRPASWPRSPTRKRRSGSATTYHLDELATQEPPRRSCASRSAARALPTDRTVVVERFRDEIGDWRVCILTPFGGRVHAPWSMALAARLRDTLVARGAVALVGRRDRAPPPGRRRAPRARRPARRARRGRGPRRPGGRADARSSASRFRENAARALLIPRRRPGPADAALAAAAQGAEPARGRAAVRLVPDRARDVSRVPAGRLRPAGAPRDPARACSRASSTSSRSRRPPRRRWPRRCSSTTSRPTCTRTTRPRPSGARRRSRSTGSCCASCSARRSCAT